MHRQNIPGHHVELGEFTLELETIFFFSFLFFKDGLDGRILSRSFDRFTAVKEVGASGWDSRRHLKCTRTCAGELNVSLSKSSTFQRSLPDRRGTTKHPRTRPSDPSVRSSRCSGSATVRPPLGYKSESRPSVAAVLLATKRGAAVHHGETGRRHQVQRGVTWRSAARLLRRKNLFGGKDWILR